MKKNLVLLIFFSMFAVNTAAQELYSTGSSLLGIGIGAGSAHVNPIGGPQLAVNLSGEFIVGAWGGKSMQFALGLTLDSSIDFLGPFSASIAPLITAHVVFSPKVDWYVSLGPGLQFISHDVVSGIYRFGVGFNTGFNFAVSDLVFINVGMGIQAEQIFGAAGVKFHLSPKKTKVNIKTIN
ncbi:MAG: hypothetical protein ACRCTQ_01360 [Brevinemataceae bacterium]